MTNGLSKTICALLRYAFASLQWRHNGRDSVSNHQPHDCLLNCLFRRRWKKTSKLRVTGLFVGNSPLAREFPAQMASSAENVFIWWRHHDGTCNSAHTLQSLLQQMKQCMQQLGEIMLAVNNTWDVKCSIISMNEFQKRHPGQMPVG